VAFLVGKSPDLGQPSCASRIIVHFETRSHTHQVRLTSFCALVTLACGHTGQTTPTVAKPEVAAAAPSSPPPTAAVAPIATPALAPSAIRSTAPASPAQPSQPQTARSTRTYPLVVSFGSACCGTDREAARALDRLLEGYKAEALGRETGGWGEEGEYDLCFTLVGLSEAQRRDLVRVVKAKIRRQLVDVKEDATCHHDSMAEPRE